MGVRAEDNVTLKLVSGGCIQYTNPCVVPQKILYSLLVFGTIGLLIHLEAIQEHKKHWGVIFIQRETLCLK